MPSPSLRYAGAPARRDAVLARLHERGFCTVAELAAHLEVSEMTVRRDVRQLAAVGELRIVHGGVSLPEHTVAAAGFDTRLQVNVAAKRRLAATAVQLIEPADAIAVDTGTTAHALVNALPDAYDGTVVTHSIPVMQTLLARPDARCVGLGGDLYAPNRAFIGPATVEAAARVRVRWCFLGTSAVDERGCYGVADLERATKKALMDIADHVVLLADGEKFQRSAPVLLAALGRLHAVVTDVEPPAAFRAAVAEAGVQLLVAG
ncbi:MAG: DeoR family transcriptional regulator [Streptosporangiales bacterium]|nr:DeoR family transcriptional regulator [Streptosporangiales bacterium]